MQCFFKLKGDKSELRDKAIDLHNRLCKNGFLKEESKKMFVDLFIGKKISEKIIWNKPKNQLKLFVDLLLKYEKIEGSVDKFLLPIIALIIALSLLPIAIEIYRERKRKH